MYMYTFFGLLSASFSPNLSQSFGHCTLRPSSGGWNVEFYPFISFTRVDCSKKMQ